MRISKLLSLKLFLIIFVIMSLLSIGFSMYHISIEAGYYEIIARQGASRVSTIVTGALRETMLENNKKRITTTINSIVEKEGVKKISLLNKRGEIVFSTDPKEVHVIAKMDDKMCSPCHQVNGKLKDFQGKHYYNIFTGETGERFLCNIYPIENEKSCWTAGCHAHAQNEKFLGIVRVMIPLKGVDKIISEHKSMLLGTNISLTIVMGLIVGIFIWFFVHIPVNKLIEGTKEISSGNLNHQILIKSKDEIGALALSFNGMTRDLKEAKTEITEWSNQLESRVREKTLELENTQKRNLQIEKMASLGQLSATVAHELNNPIAGILTYSKLIQKKLNKADRQFPDKDEIIRYLKMIESESERSGDIVKNLLLFSRQGNLEKKKTSINSVIESAIELVNHHLQLHNIHLNRELQNDLPELEIDPNLLKQAFIALFVNAVEAMENEGVLTIKTDHLSDEAFINIYIRDSGKGIPEEILSNIFEPFFTTKNAVKGVGLGLSSVFAIIEKHKGTIRVESKVSVGTTFLIKLPLKSVEKKA